MGVLPGGTGITIRHITQNNTPYSNRSTAHKTTQTIKDTLYTMNATQIQLQEIKLRLQLNKFILIKISILWRNRPMQELIKFRNLKERYCATVAERFRVLPPLPPFRVLLGYAVITWSPNSNEGRRDLSDVTRTNTQRCVLRMSDSSVNERETEASAGQLQGRASSVNKRISDAARSAQVRLQGITRGRINTLHSVLQRD
jgi:hypothetical protein